MGSFKSAFGLAKALLPVLYCGYLIYYFLDLGGSVEAIEENGLTPTVIGLAAVGLLFCIPLIFKLIRLIRGLGPPGPGGSARRNDNTNEDDDGGAAADAIIARYMARKAAEEAPAAPRPAAPGGGPARRPSFGRKPV